MSWMSLCHHNCSWRREGRCMQRLAFILPMNNCDEKEKWGDTTAKDDYKEDFWSGEKERYIHAVVLVKLFQASSPSSEKIDAGRMKKKKKKKNSSTTDTVHFRPLDWASLFTNKEIPKDDHPTQDHVRRFPYEFRVPVFISIVGKSKSSKAMHNPPLYSNASGGSVTQPACRRSQLLVPKCSLAYCSQA